MIVSYAVPTENTSPRWASAFALGCGGEVTNSDQLRQGDVALFGSPDRWALLQQAQREGRNWYYGDHAYFGRREFFRVTRNAYQHDGSGPGSVSRFAACGMTVDRWRSDGKRIVLCPNSPAYFERHGLTVDQWINDTVDTLRLYTDRMIVVRFKSDGGALENALRTAWACVVYTSVSGVHAALSGVPCFATAPCASLSFGSGDLTKIETPVRPDNRYEMACALAANQWTLSEIANGAAWRALNK